MERKIKTNLDLDIENDYLYIEEKCTSQIVT